MFRTLGTAVSRAWPLLLVGWVLVLLGVAAYAPPWENVVQDGDFRFMPDSLPSRVGESLFDEAFSRDFLGSNIVIVLRRVSSESGLHEQDREFIEHILKPRLEQIAEDEADSIIAKVRTFSDSTIGHLLESDDGKASLVVLELKTEFTEKRNRPTIEKIETLIGSRGDLRRERLIPAGLDLAISGSATVGRDMQRAATESAHTIDGVTLLVVLALLLMIYRAPILALIPLATVFVAVRISLMLLALLAEREVVELFAGLEIYVTVILYGAGVDYCMFLMARYKEELVAGATFDEAVAQALGKVGAALAASAGTTVVGIGMMGFAQFGKFQQVGVALSFSLLFVLAAALTFTPSLLMLAGRWAFWPHLRTEHVPATGGWISPTSLVARLMENGLFRGVWDRVGRVLVARPGTVWLSSIAALMPFAIVGVLYFDFLSYGLLSELPGDDPSVVGAKAVQEHFPAGVAGPVTLLLENRDVDFSNRRGIEGVDELTRRLDARKDELGIADIRSVARPFGIAQGAAAAAEREKQDLERLTVPQWFTAGIRRKRVLDHYVSDQGSVEKHVTRIDVLFQSDPFSRDSIRQFERFKQTVQEELPDELRAHAKLFYIGPTSSIRDLKAVTGSDQIRIDILVVAGVFLVLVLLLRRPVLSAYLIVSVLFSYLVTLGVTLAFFWSLDPGGFAGLDWKVPILLFTILIAVGEDYNIYLITRIEEEQVRHGPIGGVTVALSKTGGIISSCGFIMAGTFSTMMAGSLAGMTQLGFALAFGVLLDTFVVRPILVPAYLILLHSGRFGGAGRFLGAREYLSPPSSHLSPSLKVGRER